MNERRTSFGDVAEAYDAARPSYPEAVFDNIVSYGSLEPGDTVLEIGAGTGKATEGFAARGLRVHALEPSAGMARVLRAKGFDVEECAFENWTVQPGAYALVAAAQAWHWVGGKDRFDRAANALRPNGTLALFWNIGRDHREPFKTVNDAIYARLWPASVKANTRWTGDELLDALQSCRLLTEVSMRSKPWARDYTSAEWIAMLRTHSDHLALPPDTRDRLHAEVAAAIDAHGGLLRVDWDTQLYLARRR